MTPIVFLPGFDGIADLRGDFLTGLQRQHPIRAVTYPLRRLGTLDAYRQHAMTFMPVDWKPVLVAESFSGLVAARWAALDPRVRGIVLCGAFARNPGPVSETVTRSSRRQARVDSTDRGSVHFHPLQSRLPVELVSSSIG